MTNESRINYSKARIILKALKAKLTNDHYYLG